VLLAIAIGDYQVSPVGAHILARTIEAKNLEPVNRPIWGVPSTPGPFQGSGIIEFSFGLPPSPITNTPPMGPDIDNPHEKVRYLPSAQTMSDWFLREGIVKQACSDVCDPN
jgi:hypothetical protein